jgi:hypothetical protein
MIQELYGGDTTEFIWNHYFLVRVPQLQTMSESYLRIVGHPITGDPGIDREVMNQWLTTWMTINSMVDYYKDGVQIRVVTEADTKLIYEAVEQHLEKWAAYLRRGVNTGAAPIEDLIAMDRFAHEVYGFAKWHFTPEILGNMLGQQFSDHLAINKHTFFRPTREATFNAGMIGTDGVTRVSLSDAAKPPERESLGDFLKQRMARGNRWD